MRTRLHKDPDTGMAYLVDIDTCEPVYQEGKGIKDSLISVGKKLTSIIVKSAIDEAKETAKRGLKSKLKGNDKTSETIKKTADQVVKETSMINDKLKNNKQSKKYIDDSNENKGDIIVNLLKVHPDNKKFQIDQPKKTKLTEKQLNNQLLSLEFDKLTGM